MISKIEIIEIIQYKWIDNITIINKYHNIKIISITRNIRNRNKKITYP